MAGRGSDDFHTERRRVLRQAAVCGVFTGAAVGGLSAVLPSALALILAGPRAAFIAFAVVWIVCVLVSTAMCLIGALCGGVTQSTLVKWGLALGAVAGAVTAKIPSWPSEVNVAAFFYYCVVGVALALVVGHVWRRYMVEV